MFPFSQGWEYATPGRAKDIPRRGMEHEDSRADVKQILEKDCDLLRSESWEWQFQARAVKRDQEIGQPSQLVSAIIRN